MADGRQVDERGAGEVSAPARRMRRADRREQLLAAATRAFARTGFAATSLDDVVAEAGVSRVILYRHFESKADMYRAVLERVCGRLEEAVGSGDYDEGTIPDLLRAARADPDGFRLLFRYAAGEPEFREFTSRLGGAATEIAHRHLAESIPDARWAAWASHLVPTVAIEAVIAWLDAGQPGDEAAAERIGQAIQGVIDAARLPDTPER
ncbi:TetR/AcrR family transcriptional regulator [Actinobacteria bacterium YIM 96077]|uniref:TetR family transcriptional regulator n=1 Tax=Phytoactinopolyspora halophila TaxID=1981511 RepID=A0A329R2I0_9ACTN|nr:TetR/AcrR family transcriptional regulator [Phytoactinopolyspora halophila]AYY11988.1 TetR/AcrR family transcriptional regulator [Actinobacteria bacterium YIM 96077]RAW18777.1 TetR family transcriptional regulator [Phytoactinopolyspora halophila]